MRLKILIVPLLIVMILVISIANIKPALDRMQSKKAELAVKSSQVANMKSVIDDIAALNGALDTQPESEQFVARYFPKSMDQWRVIDMVNYVALQSGVLIISLDVKIPPKENPLEASAILLDGTLAPLGPDGLPLVRETPKADSFIIKTSVQGSYENIRSFLTRLSHIDRFHTLRSYGVAINDKLLNDPEQTPESILASLIGTFEANFDFYGEKSVESAIDLPVFQKSELELTALGEALSRVSNPVPTLEKPATGKPNPFQ